MVVAAAAGRQRAQTATNDTSPVNLSNNIDMANGTAAAAAVVTEGDARFEVLAPEVIRMKRSARLDLQRARNLARPASAGT